MQRKPTKKGANEQTIASMSDEQLKAAIANHSILTSQHCNKVKASSKSDMQTLYGLAKEQSILAARQCEFITESTARMIAKNYLQLYSNPLLSTGRELTPVPVIKKRSEKTIHLICINDGEVTLPDGSTFTTEYPIYFLDRYTSTGKVQDSEGRWCYPINELDKRRFVIERFVISKTPSKK